MMYRDAEAWAKTYDASLLATDKRFANAVSVSHEDGSFFFWKNSFYIKLASNEFVERLKDPDEWVHPEGGDVYYCVFTEHFGFHIFDSTDLNSIQELGTNQQEHEYYRPVA